jgi:hypothetical protein
MRLTTREDVARLMREVQPAHLCCHCLTEKLQRGLTSIRFAVARLEGLAAFTRRHATCGGCGKTRLVIGVAAAASRY